MRFRINHDMTELNKGIEMSFENQTYGKNLSDLYPWYGPAKFYLAAGERFLRDTYGFSISLSRQAQLIFRTRIPGKHGDPFFLDVSLFKRL